MHGGGGYGGGGYGHGGGYGYGGHGYGYGYRGYGYGYGYRGYGYGGWYPGVGFYFGGYPWYGAVSYAYPAYYPYAPYYYPYPAYVQPRPTVYIQRPPAIAPAPPPVQAKPAPPAPRISRYTLSAQELFGFDSAHLASPQPKLDEIASALAANPSVSNVRITGYTDRLGTDAYNSELSLARAEAVKRYLVSKGVPASRLNAVGRGKSDPVVQCNERAREALIKCLEPNRRVEIEPITIEQRSPS